MWNQSLGVGYKTKENIEGSNSILYGVDGEYSEAKNLAGTLVNSG